MVALRTEGRGVVIEGPSGIGKTTAVTRALDAADLTADFQLLSARVPQDHEYIALLPSLQDFGVVVIDDFHLLPEPLKARIANHLKVLADSAKGGSKIVIVGINRAGDALVRYADDLSGRLETIRFEAEATDVLRGVVDLGEKALNVSIDAAAEIVAAAQGSFYLVQQLCYEACLAAEVFERVDQPMRIEVSYDTIRDQVMGRQETRFGSAVRNFARGRRFRPNSSRAPYLTLLKWLAESDRWEISLDDEIRRHPEHSQSVGQIVTNGYVNDAVAAEGMASLVHYDKDGKVLSVEDPMLVFYLRNLHWDAFARDLGFTNATLVEPYDFAVSFAGSDRVRAEALVHALQARGFLVFYDQNEAHLMAGTSLEEFLGPIYRSGSRYVIAILGLDYPNRRWTVFESTQFKDRYSQSRVIPICVDGVGPSVFDASRDVGYLSYDSDKDLDSEASRLAEVIVKVVDADYTSGLDVP